MRIPLPMFTAPSYGDRTLNEVQRCVNLYPEKTATGWKLIGSPGLSLLGAVANNLPCRGAYLTTTGRIFSVHDNDLYEIPTVFPATDRGDLNTTSGHVRFCDSGLEMLIVDGADGYVYDFAADTLTAIVDPNFPTSPTWCAFHDGRFIVTESGSDIFYLSALNDPADWTPITFATEESSGDNLNACLSTGDQIWFIGSRTSVPWYNTGNASFPYERITGGAMKVGCNDVLSIAQMGKSIFMIGIGDGQNPGVWAIDGGGARKISTPYIDTAILNGATYGWVGQDGLGHRFYQVNAPTISWVYDIDQGTWWEKDSDLSGSYSTNRISHAVQNSNGILTVFDSINGSVYQVLPSVNTENGVAIRRRRVFGPIEAGAMRVFHHKIRFVLEVDHDSSATYTLEAVLDWTDDGGLTWSTARTLSKAITSGTTGQWVILDAANRLGSSRQRYYRLTFTGPSARIVLQSAELEADVGSN